MKYTIIIYLVSEWETFHRRPMIEALAKNMIGTANIICINPIVSPRGFLLKRKLRSFNRIFPVLLEKQTDNLFVATPRSIIPFRGRLKNWEKVKKELISILIKRVLKSLDLSSTRVISWFYRPEQIDTFDLAGETGHIYECYDEYQLDARSDQFLPHMKDLEMSLLSQANIVFTTSQRLYEKRSRWHPNVHLIPNGVDIEHFGKALSESISVAPELLRLGHPIIGYPGNISHVVDIELIEYIAKERPDWSFVLLGKVSPDMSSDSLRNKSNIYLLGYQSYEQLPAFSKGFDIVVLPFLINEYLNCLNPLILWEYLASGKPVVSSNIEELRKYKDVIYLANNEKEFLNAIGHALNEDNSKRVKKGLELAKNHSWNNLTQKIVEIIENTF